MEITKEMFQEWKAHPVTIEVFQEVQRAKDRLIASMSEGMTIGNTAEVTHGLTNKAVAQIEGLNQLLNITYEEEEPIEVQSNFSDIIEN
jgi:hypothetical protein